jgi:hypothetical protein
VFISICPILLFFITITLFFIFFEISSTACSPKSDARILDLADGEPPRCIYPNEETLTGMLIFASSFIAKVFTSPAPSAKIIISDDFPFCLSLRSFCAILSKSYFASGITTTSAPDANCYCQC